MSQWIRSRSLSLCEKMEESEGLKLMTPLGRNFVLREVVIERSYTLDEVLVPAFALRIPAKLTAAKLDWLCKSLPMDSFGLGHLKRVKKSRYIPDTESKRKKAKITPTDTATDSTTKEVEVQLPQKSQINEILILLCTEAYYHSSLRGVADDKWKEALSNGISLSTDFESSFSCEMHGVSVERVMVSSMEPRSRREFEDWGASWPINFHPNELSRLREKGLESADVASICAHVDDLLADINTVKKGEMTAETTGGVVVNPLNDKVVCCSADAAKFFALPPINGKTRVHPMHTATYLSVRMVGAIAKETVKGIDLLPEGHYLCTGLDLYLNDEPELMSAMALVHSRIRRVFFINANAIGALKSGNGHIHANRQLNHRYRAFQIELLN